MASAPPMPIQKAASQKRPAGAIIATADDAVTAQQEQLLALLCLKKKVSCCMLVLFVTQLKIQVYVAIVQTITVTTADYNKRKIAEAEALEVARTAAAQTSQMMTIRQQDWLRTNYERQQQEQSLNNAAFRDHQKREDDMRMISITQQPAMMQMQLQASTASVLAAMKAAPLPQAMAVMPYQQPSSAMPPFSLQPVLNEASNSSVEITDDLDAQIATLQKQLGF